MQLPQNVDRTTAAVLVNLIIIRALSCIKERKAYYDWQLAMLQHAASCHDGWVRQSADESERKFHLSIQPALSWL